MIVEGARVAYAGDTDPFQSVGSRGKVLALSGTCAHVQWSDGPKVGQIDLVDQNELVPDRTAIVARQVATSSFDEALDAPVDETSLVVRATYDRFGEDGLVNALAEAGHLAMLSEYVEEAVGHIATRIRLDPGMESVLAQLETDEADNLVGRVASVLLTDRLKES